jgi:DNA transposition AAA+ family ATPase
MTTHMPGTGTLAPLKNVALFQALVERVQNRAAHLPGLAVFYGHSGFGKTFSAVYAANRARAYYIEVGETWTRRTLCDAVLKELGETPHGSVTDKVEAIVYRLGEDAERPLIIDEADFLIRRSMVDVIREIHDKSQTPVILIGEELLPSKLMKWERAHNRVLDWVAAEACDLEDARHLARLYAPEVEIEDDLLAEMLRASGGRARRICVNVERIREHAALLDLPRIDRAAWGQGQFFTGEPPKRRVA